MNHTESKATITSATVDSIMDTIEHDLMINNVAKELIKEVVRDEIAITNKDQNPNLQSVIEHIKTEEWSDLFAESALRTIALLKTYQ